MAELKNITEYNLKELSDELAPLNVKGYAVGQIFGWAQKYTEIGDMTNVSKSLREKLSAQYRVRCLETVKVLRSADGTKKYLLRLADGNAVECVYMPNNYGNTVCISTQVGCRMGCRFCASTRKGLIRSMTAGEMLAEVLLMNADNAASDAGDRRALSNVVLMGIGEPFDNYDNVVRFLRLVSDSDGINISCRNISLSTCGIVPGILRFADEGLPVTLAVSLHNAFDENRKKLMPVANKWSIAEIIDAARTYFRKTGRRVIFEYALVEGVNDRREDAVRLSQLLKGMSCHVNLIPLNPVAETQLSGSGKRATADFLGMLTEMNVSATVRRATGSDINSSCGQLRLNEDEALCKKDEEVEQRSEKDEKQS